jgi:hypothetical protein
MYKEGKKADHLQKGAFRLEALHTYILHHPVSGGRAASLFSLFTISLLSILAH